MGKKIRSTKNLSVNHAATAPLDDLDLLLAEVEMPTEIVEDDEAPVASVADLDEVVEHDFEGVFDELDAIDAIEDAPETSVEAAVAAIEREEVYAAVEPDPAVEAKPVEIITSHDVVITTPKPPAKAAKGEKKARAPKAPKVPKAPAERKERIYFGSDKVKRLRHTLGDKLSEFMVLTLEDATLDGDALKEKQDETLAIIEAMGIKVKNRATLLLEFASGKTHRLNNVISTALALLAKDGHIVTGDKGNLFQTLVAKPYAPSAARAMGNNTVNMLRQLKLITPSDDRSTFVANPQSLLLAFIAPKLGLEFGGMDEGEFDDEIIEVTAPVSAASAETAEVPSETLEDALEALEEEVA